MLMTTLRPPRPCPKLRNTVRQPPAYFAESTRVLCGKYNSVLHTPLTRFLMPRRLTARRGNHMYCWKFSERYACGFANKFILL